MNHVVNRIFLSRILKVVPADRRLVGAKTNIRQIKAKSVRENIFPSLTILKIIETLTAEDDLRPNLIMLILNVEEIYKSNKCNHYI